jgi:hypothetical protein
MDMEQEAVDAMPRTPSAVPSCSPRRRSRCPSAVARRPPVEISEPQAHTRFEEDGLAPSIRHESRLKKERETVDVKTKGKNYLSYGGGTTNSTVTVLVRLDRSIRVQNNLFCTQGVSRAI